MGVTRTLDEYFVDWEADVFGFGYGSGEPYTIPAVKSFLAICPDTGNYNYEVLEAALTPVVAWLLINAMAKANVIEYGTSPRFGWLTPQGRALKAFVASKSADDLIALVCEGEAECSRGYCNCGHDKCPNPFFHRPSLKDSAS